MAQSESTKKKDVWEKADVVGKSLIPITVALATIWFNSALKEREARQKTLEVAIGILQAPNSDETKQLREWALGVFRVETGAASAELPGEAVKELQQGTQLPSISQLRLPSTGQVRVSIIRLLGTSPDQSERIKSALIIGGYPNVTTTEEPQDLFPKKAEVRFYYPGDRQNAESLSNYISNQSMGVATEISDKSRDPDASKHRPGDLHVYIR
jgi:hypothetical protein